MYIRATQDILENYIIPFKHKSNCVSCALRFLGYISDKDADILSSFALLDNGNSGLIRDIVTEILKDIRIKM